MSSDIAAPLELFGQDQVDVPAPEQADQSFWSVTTIIGALDKPALMYWAAEQTAVAAVGSQSTWRGMLADDHTGCTHTSARECATVKWLRDARYRRPRDLLSAKDLGTVVHALAEQYALTGTRPGRDAITAQLHLTGGDAVDVAREGPVAEAMLDRFDGWLQRFTPTYRATEMVVYSPTYGYAGQADALLEVDGFEAIVDYKSSREPFDSQGAAKTPYPEVALQLAAYRWAELAAVWRPRRFSKFRRRYYLLSQAEQAQAVPVPRVDGGLCLHITPESCEAFPVICDASVHTTFLYVMEAARWSFETSRTVIGPPLAAAGDQQ